MKKRLCTLCLILLAVGTTFAGCKKKTSDEPASEKKVTQTVATEEPQLADNHEGQAQSILTGEHQQSGSDLRMSSRRWNHPSDGSISGLQRHGSNR